MDQKEIDALVNQGSVADFNKQQAELLKHLVEQPASTPSPPPSSSDEGNLHVPEKSPEPSPSKGKVMGQLSRVTEEAEAGTNMVMGYLENVLTFVSRQQSFIEDIVTKYEETPSAINVSEALNFLKDNLVAIEEAIFNAMDAFQFQDIGRQKLMKVMYTLAKLNEYLNELLGGDTSGQKTFGHKIEKKTMEQDRDKVHVDEVVSGFQNEKDTNPSPPPAETTNDMADMADSADVDSIVAAFKNQSPEPPQPEKKSDGPLGNDDIDGIIAEFQNRQK